MLQSLKALLGTPPGDYPPSILLFMPLDLGKVEKELLLEDRGTERGKDEQPPTESITFDDVETSVTSRFEQEKRYWLDAFHGQVDSYNQRMAGLNLQNRFTEVRAVSRRAIGEFKTEAQLSLSGLSLERENVLLSKKSLRHFRETNRLLRPANYPLSWVLHFSVIALILMIEAIANGALLGQMSERGLIGGITSALLIATINVLISWMVGRWGAPWIHHRNVAVKGAALLGLAAWAILMVWINLGVGHYRDAVLAGTPSPEVSAIASLWAEPLAITDMYSWITVGMGLAFSVIAMVDGFKMDDRYPGYGREERKHREVYADYNSKAADAIDALRDIRDNAIERFSTERSELSKARREHDTISSNRHRLDSQFRDHLNYLEDAANKLLSVYRSANTRARKTPPPIHFGQRWAMARPDVDLATPMSMSSPSLDRALQDTETAIETAISELHDEFDRVAPLIKNIDELWEDSAK